MKPRIGISLFPSRVPGNFRSEPDMCGYIRMLLPFQHPAMAHEFDIQVLSADRATQYEADVFYVNRTAINDEALEEISAHCKNTGALLIYDLDDPLFAILESHPEYEHYRQAKKFVLRCFETVGHVTVSSPVLKEMIGTRNGSVYILPNAVDERLYLARPPARHKDVVRILYMGTLTHEEDLEVVETAVKRVRRKFRKRVAFDLIGGLPKAASATGFDRIAVPDQVRDSYPAFITWLSGINDWSIGLAPLVISPFNKAKSGLKYVDYAALGLASVCTDIEPYRAVIRDRVDGLLVKNTEPDWYGALCELVENPELRESIAAAALEDFRKRHTLAAQAEARIAFWRGLVPNPRGLRRIPGVRPRPSNGGGGPPPAHSFHSREDIAAHFLRGTGIEVGALQKPLRTPPGARVQYVDRMKNEMLYEQYPELRPYRLVEVDIVDDGESLGTLADGSQDFVIANHFIEHCQDPIATLQAFSRVLKSNGTAFLAVPNRHQTWDKDRAATSLQHLIADHEQGPAVSRRQHFEEWVKFVEPHFGRSYPDSQQFNRRVEALVEMNYSIHFHVWNPDEFLEFLHYTSSFLPLHVDLYRPFDEEMVAILRKTG